jgi:hypothetical protein
MSVGSIAANTWTPPFPPRSTVGSACGGFSPPLSDASASTSGTGTSISSSTDPFQQLASDIQAMLLQAQSGTVTQAASTVGSATTGASGIGSTTPANPEQQLATDAQSMLAQLQSDQAGSGTTAQTATAGQAGPGEARPHHHHHHHQNNSQSGGDTVSGTTASSTTAASAAATSGTSSNRDQAVSQAFATEIMQALQAYGSAPSTTAVPGLTA